MCDIEGNVIISALIVHVHSWSMAEVALHQREFTYVRCMLHLSKFHLEKNVWGVKLEFPKLVGDSNLFTLCIPTAYIQMNTC